MKSAGAALIAGLAALVVYVLTLCPTIYAGDSGELAWAADSLGLAHPPGYPLWTLLGRVALVVSPAGAAVTLNFTSALFAAAAVGLLAALLGMMTGRRRVSAGVALAFAFSRDLWSQATITEVYALNMLLLTGVLAATVASRTRGDRWGWLAAYLLGLGVANHPLVLSAAPAVVVLLLWPREDGRGFVPSRLLPLAATFVLGITAYVYLPVRWSAGPEMNWGGIRNLSEVWDHIMRTQYGGLGEASADTSLGVRLRVFAQLLAENVTPFLLLVGAFGFFRAMRGGRARAVFVLLLLLGTGPVVAGAIRFEDTFLDRSVASVFFLPAYLAAFVVAGLGAGALDRLASERLAGQGRMAALATLVIALVPAVFLAQRNFRSSDRSESELAEVYSRTILQALPPDARLYTTGDNATFLLAYFQRVEGLRPDITLSDRTLNLFVDSYGEDFPDMSRPERKAHATEREVATAYEQTDSPVFYSGEIDLEPFGGCRLVPAGLVYQLLRPGETALSIPHETLRLPPIDTRDYLEAHLAGVALLRQGRWMLENGRTEEGLESLARAGVVGQRIAPIQRNVGLQYLLRGDAESAEYHFRAALDLEPKDEDTLYNLGVLCAQTDRPDEALGYFDRIVAQGTEYAEVHLNRGAVLIRLGRLEDAGEAAAQALLLEPDLEPAAELQAAVKRGLEIGGEAGVLEAQVALDPLAVGGTLQLAEKYLERGEPERAHELYREVYQSSPGSFEAAYGLGYGLLRLGQVPEAADAFRRVLALDPASAAGRNALAYIYALSGENLEAAEILVREALELDPTLAAYWNDTLGWVLYRAGRLEAALAALQESERELPVDDISMRAENDYHQGVVLMELDRAAEAKGYFVRCAARVKDEPWRPDLMARGKELGLNLESL